MFTYNMADGIPVNFSIHAPNTYGVSKGLFYHLCHRNIKYLVSRVNRPDAIAFVYNVKRVRLHHINVSTEYIVLICKEKCALED